MKKTSCLFILEIWDLKSKGCRVLKNEGLNSVVIHREENSVTDEVCKTESPNVKSNRFPGLINSNNFARIFYIISGVFIFLSLIVIVNTYVLHLKVETAVVSAEIETMTSPVGGYITDVYVSSGEQVKKGMPLLKIENLDLERKLQLARVKMEESMLDVDYYQQLLANELQRLNIYKKIGHNRVASAQSIVNMSKRNVMTAQQNLARFEELHKKNYISKSILEATQAKYENAQEQLNNANAQQNVESHSLHAVDKGMYFTGTKTEGISHDLDAELRAAQKKVALNQMRVKIYENLIARLTLRAPFDGKVTQIMKSAGNTADNTTPLVFIEKTSESRHIVAWLTQDEIIHIGASGKVKIYSPSSGETYHGNITEINRTDGFIDEVKAQYRWRDFQVDRSAMITIAIQPRDQTEFNQHAFSGMPVVVYFSKKTALF